MAISFRLINSWTVKISGISTTFTSKAAWRVEIDLMAKILQAEIFNSYAASLDRGINPFLPNTPAYTLWKARHGMDIRRGHQRGRTLRALAGRRLFIITGITDGGSANIVFLEERLYGRAPHARWYARRKIPFVRRILALNPAWLFFAGFGLVQFDAKVQQKNMLIAGSTVGGLLSPAKQIEKAKLFKKQPGGILGGTTGGIQTPAGKLVKFPKTQNGKIPNPFKTKGTPTNYPLARRWAKAMEDRIGRIKGYGGEPILGDKKDLSPPPRYLGLGNRNVAWIVTLLKQKAVRAVPNLSQAETKNKEISIALRGISERFNRKK